MIFNFPSQPSKGGKSHQPQMSFQIAVNFSTTRPLVKMSAGLTAVSIFRMFVFINCRLRHNSKGASHMKSSRSFSNDEATRNEVTAAGGECIVFSLHGRKGNSGL